MKYQSCFGIIILALLMGCAPLPTTPPHSPPVTPTAQPALAATVTPPPTLPLAVPIADPAEAARAHLAGLLGINVNEITVVSSEQTEMELAGLGCTQKEPPQPAMVIGTEVVLSAGGRTFIYHVHGRQVVLCK